MFQRYIVVVEHWNTFFGGFTGFSSRGFSGIFSGILTAAKEGFQRRENRNSENQQGDPFSLSGGRHYFRRPSLLGPPPLLEFPYSPSLPKTLGIRLGKGKLLLLSPPLETLKRLILLRSEEGTGYGLPSPCMNTR
jgi:hypothetical protein